MGIEMAGLDVIDNKIIEVNVTSPCYFIKEINNLYNIHLETALCDYILTKAMDKGQGKCYNITMTEVVKYIERVSV